VVKLIFINRIGLGEDAEETEKKKRDAPFETSPQLKINDKTTIWKQTVFW
jgi:glutaredoxin